MLSCLSRKLIDRNWFEGLQLHKIDEVVFAPQAKKAKEEM
jgi:hypothetical protein